VDGNKPDNTGGVLVDRIIDGGRMAGMQLGVVVLCLLIAIIDGFDVGAMGFTAPAISQEWGIDVGDFGPVFGVNLFGMMVGGMLLGPLADRYGRRNMIILSIGVVGVFTAAAAFATSVQVLLVLRLISGIGMGGLTPNLIALSAEYAPARVRSTVVTVVVCGMTFGMFVGGMVSSALIPAFGWQAVFHSGGWLALVLLVAALLWLPESTKLLVQQGSHDKLARILRKIDPSLQTDGSTRFTITEQKVTRSPITALFTDGRAVTTLLLWLVFFLTLLIIYFLSNWLPALFTQAGLGDTNALVASSLYQLGGVAGGLALGILSDRRGSLVQAVGGCYLLGAVFLGVTVLGIGSAAIVMVTVFIVGFGISGSITGMSAVAAQVYPTQVRSTGVGWAYSIGRIGSIIGPTVGGVFVSLGTAPTTLLAYMIVPTLCAVVSVLVLAARKPAAASAQQPGQEAEKAA